jgi:proton glutamate symport protein
VRLGEIKLHWQILLALAAALGVGLLTPRDAALFGVGVQATLDFVGTLFLRALKMLIVPLIAASIISAVVGLGAIRGFGRLGLKTAGYYVLTTTIAVTVGLVLVDLIEPGLVDGTPARDRIGLSADTAEVAQKVQGRGARDVVGVLLRLVPENVIADAAQGEMLGVIFFSLLFGYFAARIPERYARSLGDFWQGVYDVMVLITEWVMRFAPLGVFALVAKVVMTTGFAAFRPLAWFVVVVLGGLALHAFVVLPLLIRLLGGASPMRHLRAVGPALLMAFSTASSAATLPLTIDCVQKRAGVSRRVTSFTLPLGATINMDGTALYECVAAMFIAQAYGVEISIGGQFLVVLLAVLTSIGVAGVPAASLVAITLILGAIGLPLEAIGLILAVDRVLDMCRTSVNVLGDTTAAVIIGKSEGEASILRS